MRSLTRLLPPPRLVHMVFPGGWRDLGGKKLLRQKKWSEAASYYAKWVKRYPGNSLLLERLAGLQNRLGELDSSESNFRILAIKHPRISRYVSGLVDVLKKKERFSDAFSLLDEFLSRNPQSSRVAEELGIMLAERGEWKKAKTYFHRSFSSKIPSSPSSTKFLDYCVRYEDHEEILRFNHFPRQFLQIQKCFTEVEGFDYAHWYELRQTSATVFRNKALYLADRDSPNVHVVDGCRVTIGNPDKFDRTLHVYGPCHVYGLFYNDKHTLPSCMQAHYNAKAEERVRVVNMGDPGPSSVSMLKLMASDLGENDILVFFSTNLFKPLLDVSEVEKEVETFEAIQTLCHARGILFYVVHLPFSIANKYWRKTQKKLIREEVYPLSVSRAAAIIQTNRMLRDEMLSRRGIKFYDTMGGVERLFGNAAIFFDEFHFSPKALSHLAGLVCDFILANPYIPEKTSNDNVKGRINSAIKDLGNIAKSIYGDRNEIRRWLESVRCPAYDGMNSVGAVVVNCNPFTWGHYHLISQAVAQVEGLYVFVVQEDLSFFPFEDRISLVREGLAEFGDRVHVVPSGKFIISSFSFAGYFTKERQVSPPDSTTDVLLFGAVIAPELNISTRFVGEEPNCATTRSYNETMAQLLPPIGIELSVIPRIGIDAIPISATTVRKCLADGDFSKIAELVPETTLKYLHNRFA